MNKFHMPTVEEFYQEISDAEDNDLIWIVFNHVTLDLGIQLYQNDHHVHSNLKSIERHLKNKYPWFESQISPDEDFARLIDIDKGLEYVKDPNTLSSIYRYKITLWVRGIWKNSEHYRNWLNIKDDKTP